MMFFLPFCESEEPPPSCATLWPMYTVALDVLLQMTKLEVHEELKAKGVLEVFEQSKGNAAFVSHQWVGLDHPDPEFEQMQVLQAALRHAILKLNNIPLDVITEIVLPAAKDLPTSKLLSRPLFIWYDYFSCPQLDEPEWARGGVKNIARAIESIPAYVTKCAFFLVLCPVVESRSLSKILTPSTWAERGWCRLERACCELGRSQSWIMVKGPSNLELLRGSGFCFDMF